MHIEFDTAKNEVNIRERELSFEQVKDFDFSAAIEPPLRELATQGLPPGFLTQTLLAYVAMFCLPRQFQVGVVECENSNDVRHARRLFPLYLLLICFMVLPIRS